MKAQRTQEETLAILHLETTAGKIRISVSEDEDGNLVSERVCSEMPYVFPVRRIRRGKYSLKQARKLVQETIDDVETFAEVTGAHQIEV